MSDLMGEDAVARLRRIEEARTKAFYSAFGSAGDDPEDPSVIAAFQQDRLAFLQISPALISAFQADARRRAGDDDAAAQRRHQMALLGFNSLVNGVVHAARESWRSDFAERLNLLTGGGR